MLLGNTQKVKLFICRKLFICVFEILNPGGPLISMIFFFFLLLCQRHKGFKLIHNKHLYFFHLNPWCCDPSLFFTSQVWFPKTHQEDMRRPFSKVFISEPLSPHSGSLNQIPKRIKEDSTILSLTLQRLCSLLAPELRGGGASAAFT